jgi:glucuronate isomerase
MTRAPFADARSAAQTVYEAIRDMPIVSPHGHCDPRWWATDAAFPDPAELLIIPDHYVFRMLYSQGVSLEDLGIGVPAEDRDPRAIFRLFAKHWPAFLGTPSRQWITHTLSDTLGIDIELTAQAADQVYDAIEAQLADPAFAPRALFDAMPIEVLATTDAALDPLDHHAAIKASGWAGRIVPTFRPDDVLNPAKPGHAANLRALGAMTGQDTGRYAGFLAALQDRRAAFKAMGATATDHDVPDLLTNWLARSQVEALYDQALRGTLSVDDALRFYGHMLIEMAQMSAEDGLVMQIHAGSQRSTNQALLDRYGTDMGADIPHAVDWVHGLSALLNRVGNTRGFRLIAFTLDEASYARELAPMAGHWPALCLGPPWWFHDSPNGIRRYFDQVVETAGYANLVGFNDDTRAFLSIPARHDMWRQGVSQHLADQIDQGVLRLSDAMELGPKLAHDLALKAYRLCEDGI